MRSPLGLTLAAALLCSCGPKAPCGPSTCPGCCDTGGACRAGSERLACGQGGASCVSCPEAQRCSFTTGTCGNCGPANCAGCCGRRSSDDCQPGNTLQSCGYGGYPCDVCGAGEACFGGFCK